ncbi:RNA 2',3'-cyclic phosphodiesterase [Clostridium brassicae]|uniref:RNA 2',3'-cyclic phosphodiesterase n=1 Tax=Clostridium brassicae TaxID=2999072 RepID=UPI0038991794
MFIENFILKIIILQELKRPPKQLVVSNIGSFKREKIETIWCGIEKNKELVKFQEQLRKLLVKNRFSIDNRKYKPHITLGRQVIRRDLTKEIIIDPIKVPIYSIALMESKRVNNQLVYEVLEEIVL